MKSMNPITLTVLLIASGCAVNGNARSVQAEQAPTADTRAPLRADPTTDANSDGQLPHLSRITFSAQPTEAQLRDFAASGGRVVINYRTEEEMEQLDFDERALVESLGMTYVHIPMNSANFSEHHAAELARTLKQTRGPILAHCASGSRAATAYGLYLIKEHAMEKDRAIETAVELGMRPSAGRLIERELMVVPARVMDSVDPANLRSYVDTLAGFGTRHTLSETDSDTRGIGAARRWVKAQFERNISGHGKHGDAAPRVYFDEHEVEPDGRRITEPVRVVNVVCEIPGTDPSSRDHLYYAIAHLDSRTSDVNDTVSDAPGANDDASGVALLLELARVLAREPIESTVVLMATSGEEQGLYGARLHAQRAREAGRDIRAVLNNDTVGDPTGVLEGQDGSKKVRVFSEGISASVLSLEGEQLRQAVRGLRLYGEENDSPSRQLARFIAEVADLHKTAVQPWLIHRPDRYLRGGDHTPFNELGFAAVRFCEPYENYDRQHQDVRTEDGVQYGDLPEHVDERYLAEVARLNALTLAHLANAPSAPDDTRIIVSGLTNDTTLRWAPSPEPDVAGYEIVWRETTASQWQHAMDVGAATEGTVPLSKDNWFFGVRAYDKDGYRSPVSTPRPARE